MRALITNHHLLHVAMNRSFQATVMCLAIGTALCFGLISPVAAQITADAQSAGEALPVGDAQRGRQLFQNQCAVCHGSEGQGVEDHYRDPLQGDYPPSHLLEIIEQTMPEEEPDSCIGEDARDVTAFVFEQFYSETAKLRRQAARIELSRLTVPQYRNSLTDLLLSFQSESKHDGESGGELGGLQATYFKTRQLRDDDKVFQRTDPLVDFDFEKRTPTDDKKFKPEEFSIRWEGGLLAEQTGVYEIRLHTENGARLWLNDPVNALIDAGVRSGERTERYASLFLLGGRTYSIRLDFFKHKEERASVSLLWVPPGGIQEPIPSRNLARGTFPKLFVPSTAFPPDDRSIGYERGVSVSKSWTEATTQGAIEAANEVIQRLDELAGLGKNDSKQQRREKTQAFCHRFVQRAFRRPLDEKLRELFVDRFFVQQPELDQAVKRVVVLALKSPRFLYPNLNSIGGDDFDVATRLAYGLWDSLPDDALLAAAHKGKLKRTEQVTAEARRMLDHPRTRAKLSGFFHDWLQIDPAQDLSKDLQAYPDFDARLIADLRVSLDQFIKQTIWSDKSDFRRLLLEETVFVNRRLAEFMGVDQAVDGFNDKFVAVKLESEPRSGVLTHPYLMAALSHRVGSSPIHRGVFVVRSILGRALRSPPDAVELLDEATHPDMTTRQRVEHQTKSSNCQACHAVINPLGFALENYDGVGRFRTHESSGVVDTAGAYHSLSGERIEFADARELALALADHSETHRNFVERIFEHLTKQPIRGYGANSLDELTAAFRESDFHIRELVVSCMTAAALGGDASTND
jgi:mono/diheme cytochrome c family protein